MRQNRTSLKATQNPVVSRYILALVLQGPLFAALQFGEVIARKSFNASSLTVTVLTMTMPVVSLSAIWWGQMLKGRDQRLHILILGSIGSLAIISCYWFCGMAHMLSAFALSYVSYALILTGQNRALQQHVPSGKRGGIFGLSNSLRMVMAAILSLLAGLWMDTHASGYRHVFLIAGIFGLVSAIMLASIPTKNKFQGVQREKVQFIKPLKSSWDLLKRRPDFLRFEIGFMIYGVAYMMTLPVVPIFLVDDLVLDYSNIGFARGTLMQILMIPSIFYFGKVFDKTTPQLLASKVFLMLIFYPLFLLAALYAPVAYKVYAVYLAFIVLGVAMGGITLVWHTGSVSFARDDDAGEYQAVHVAATGIRGSFAPLLAYVVMNYFGKAFALWMTVVIWLVSGLYMYYCHKKDGCDIE